MAAEWTDANTRIVTELFAEQVRRGNRPNTHLNSVGYVEVAKRFQEMAGLVYNKTQLKNKWDKLKNEYGIWNKLMRKETGAGWNIEKGTIDQDSEWWKKAKADIPGCGRFQKQGICNEDKLKVMFEDLTSNGSDHWSPATGMLPKSNIEVDESPTSSKCKRPAMLVDDKSKKPKTSQVMQEQITKIGSLAERTQSSFESFTNKEETCSVKVVMDMVVECGATFDSDEYFIGTELFVKREQREMFLHMPSPEHRLAWLKRKFSLKYGR